VTPIQLAVEPLELPLKHTFTIARSSESSTRSAVVRLRWNGLEGLGESAPIARYGESVASVVAGLRQRDLGDDPYALERLLAGLPPAQSCGLDIALHDLIGKDLGRPLWRLGSMGTMSHRLCQVKGAGCELRPIDVNRSFASDASLVRLGARL
jgi:L-Ala-D/L-Glu epimerase / N-acetyl-D-glutamate racemase